MSAARVWVHSCRAAGTPLGGPCPFLPISTPAPGGWEGAAPPHLLSRPPKGSPAPARAATPGPVTSGWFPPAPWSSLHPPAFASSSPHPPRRRRTGPPPAATSPAEPWTGEHGEGGGVTVLSPPGPGAPGHPWSRGGVPGGGVLTLRCCSCRRSSSSCRLLFSISVWRFRFSCGDGTAARPGSAWGRGSSGHGRRGGASIPGGGSLWARVCTAGAPRPPPPPGDCTSPAQRWGKLRQGGRRAGALSAWPC